MGIVRQDAIMTGEREMSNVEFENGLCRVFESFIISVSSRHSRILFHLHPLSFLPLFPLSFLPLSPLSFLPLLPSFPRRRESRTSSKQLISHIFLSFFCEEISGIRNFTFFIFCAGFF